MFPIFKFKSNQNETPSEPISKKRKTVTDDEKKEQKKKYETESRKRTFQPHWLKEFSWLRYDNAKNIMTCHVCCEYETIGVYVNGSNFFRKDSLFSHEKSVSHLNNVEKLETKNKPASKSVAAITLRKLTQYTVNQLSIKFRNVHYLCKKARPFSDYSDLCSLSESQGQDVGSTYRTNKAGTKFAECIAEDARNTIRTEIDQTKFISVIFDGTTDCSYQEAEIIFIHTCRNGVIKVYFSLVKNVPSGNAETVCAIMEEGLSSLCKNYKSKLVGTGTDGASSMMGKKTGAVQRLRESVNRPFVLGVHCSGHKLELAYKDTLKKNIPLYNKVELFLTNLYYFYRNSNTTRSGLKLAYQTLGKSVALPTRVGGTRWVGHMKLAMETFLKGYEAFVLHLGQVIDLVIP